MKTNSIKSAQIFNREELKQIRGGGEYGYGCNDECSTDANCAEKYPQYPICDEYYDQTCQKKMKFCVEKRI